MRNLLPVLFLWLITMSATAQDDPLPPPPPPPSVKLDFDTVQYKPLIRHIPSVIQTQRTPKHINVQGTRIFILPPKGFEQGANQTFHYKKDSLCSFQISDKKIAFDIAANEIRKKIAEQDAGLVLQKEMSINGEKGLFCEIINPMTPWSVAFFLTGNDSISTLGLFYTTLKNRALMTAYQKTIESYFYQPDYPVHLETLSLGSAIDLQKHKPLCYRVPSVITNKLTGKHERIKGTRIFTTPIEGFTYDGFKFNYNKEPNLWFFITDKGRNFQFVSDSIDRFIRSDQTTKKLTTDISINQYKGKLFESIDTVAGFGAAFLIIDLGETSLVGSFFIDAKDEALMSAYTNLLLSLFYKSDYPLDPRDGINFSFDTTFTNFRLARVSHNTIIYTYDGTYDDINNRFEDHITITELGPIPYERAKYTMETLPSTIENMGCTGKLTDIHTKIINDDMSMMREYQLDCKGNKYFMYTVLILGKNYTWIFESSGDPNIYKQKWEKSVESLKRRR